MFTFRLLTSLASLACSLFVSDSFPFHSVLIPRLILFCVFSDICSRLRFFIFASLAFVWQACRLTSTSPKDVFLLDKEAFVFGNRVAIDIDKLHHDSSHQKSFSSV